MGTDTIRKWREIRQLVNDPAAAKDAKVKVVLIELLDELEASEQRAEAAEQRAEQLQRDVEKLAAALRDVHRSVPYAVRLSCEYVGMSKEDFDRLIGGAT